MIINMGVIKFVFFVTMVLLLKVASCSQDRKVSDEEFLSQLLKPTNGVLSAKEAEQILVTCRLELNSLKKKIGNHESCFSLGTRNLVNFCFAQLKQSLVNCIRMNDLPFPVSGEDGCSEIAHAGYTKSLLFSPDVHRRILGRDMQWSIPADPGRVPAEVCCAGSPVLATAPSPDSRESASPPPRGSRSLASAPFFHDLGKSNQLQLSEKIASSDSSSREEMAAEIRNTVVIAVVVTAVVTLIMAAVLFLCYIRFYGTGAKVGPNDQSPLLSRSMSDYSVGALSIGGDSVKEDWQSLSIEQKIATLEGKITASHGVDTSIQESHLDYTTKSNAESDKASSLDGQSLVPPLKPPPGRFATTSSVMGSLKPPPGRPVPLPPEPPLVPLVKLSKANAGPPPPPPPLCPSARPTPPVGGPPPPRPPVPPVPSGDKPGPRPPGPPPPPKIGGGPPKPPPPLAIGSKVALPPINRPNAPSSLGSAVGGNKAKLKPFFWDKVQANPDHTMVWNQIKEGSFQFNEEMIETLFGYSANDKSKGGGKKDASSKDRGAPQLVQLIDAKKAQNLSILLRALNVTIEEVRDALLEGNELPVELIQTLLKMAPTSEEELKLRLYSGELTLLGPAERFLKALVDIPFAYKRLEALLFMCTLQEEVTSCKESFATLEVACTDLRSSRLFLKILEAVLKTGNRMNDGTFRGGAQAFKLDTLLKLSDVKGIDSKTTLLSFVVKEIMRTEGLKACKAARDNRSFSSIETEDVVGDAMEDTEEQFQNVGLSVVSRLSTELDCVKKAAVIDADNLAGTVSRLGHSLAKTRDFLNKEVKDSGEDNRFYQILRDFLQSAEVDVKSLLEDEKRIMEMVKNTGDYFHGKSGKDEGLRLFTVVRDFLIMLDKVCKEIIDSQAQKKQTKTQKQETAKSPSPSNK